MRATGREVTGKRAVRFLRGNEERFRSLIQNVSDVVTILEADGTIRYDSPAIERVLGYSPNERLGTNGFDYVHPQDLEWVRQTFLEALREGGVQPSIEFRIRHRDGSWRHVETTRSNQLENVSVRGIVTTLRDVTQRKLAEERLRQSEERYRAVIEQTIEGIYLIATDTRRIVESNAAFENMLGYTEEELRGMHVYDFVAHEREDIDSTFQSILDEGKRLIGERRYRRKGGSIVDVETSANVISYGDREVLCTVVRDVTERKRAREALRKSEARFRAIFDRAATGMALVDAEGRIVENNTALQEMLGYSGEELRGMHFAEVTHPDDLAADTNRFEKLMAGELDHFRLEKRYIRKDGSVMWGHLTSSGIRSEEDEPRLMIGMVENITERKKAEEALIESEERYRAVMEQSAEAIYIFDPETKRVLECNTAFQELIGYAAEELVEMDLYDFVAHETENIDLNVERHLLEKRRFVGERRYRKKDGSLFEVAASATLIPYQGRSAVCAVVRDITERKALEDQLRHQAFHDSVTDLPNRALFLKLLEHALNRASRTRKYVAVLFVDLDNFKIVNDSLGHEAGNELLRAVAKDLRECVRPGDTVARIFGDEFAVLLENIEGIEAATRIADRIEEKLHSPFTLDRREVFVTASIGIDIGTADRSGPKDLLRNADLAMYAAKSEGKATHELFAPSMNTRALERMDLESDLRRAIERDEFVAYYQPIVELETGEVASLEALARWDSPERGLVSPSEFVRIAEQTGLIVPIGQRVLERVCYQVREWQEEFGVESLPTVGINLSARQFSYQQELITEVLRETGVDPGRLRFEITESTVMDNVEFSIDKIENLADLGLQFAIDDFGTGYSCLRYLKRLTVDLLKIDGSFINGLEQNREDVAIVSGAVALGHALGLKVAAEGVETEEQLERLREMGCDLVQGHYFARPLTSEETTESLSRGAFFGKAAAR